MLNVNNEIKETITIPVLIAKSSVLAIDKSLNENINHISKLIDSYWQLFEDDDFNCLNYPSSIVHHADNYLIDLNSMTKLLALIKKHDCDYYDHWNDDMLNHWQDLGTIQNKIAAIKNSRG
jgi:hypothetical protein